MRVYHREFNETFILREEAGHIRVESSQAKPHSFKDAMDATWFVIEQLRTSHLLRMDETAVATAAKQSNIDSRLITKSLVNAVRQEKITRSFYDQVLIKVLSALRSGADEFVLSSTQNFIVTLEIQHLLRKHLGTKTAVSTLA